MENIFSDINKEEFFDLIKEDEKCLEFLATQKWKDGYRCNKCGHTNYCKGKTPFSRRCTKCKHEESAGANTIFHRCKIPISQAFEMVYMVCNTPDISSYELSRVMQLRQMTCWKFKKRITECLDRKAMLKAPVSNSK